MSISIRPLKLTLASILSWSLTTAPFIGLPLTTRAYAQQAAINPLALRFELEDLLERADFPNVPRRGVTGLPSQQEMYNMGQRLLSLRDQLRHGLPAQIRQPTRNDQIPSALVDINNYFDCVRLYEGIRIILGQASDPTQWQRDYNVEIAMDHSFYELRFAEGASFFAEHYIGLPVNTYDADFKAFENATSDERVFTVRLDNRDGVDVLSFSPNASKIAKFDTFALIQRPSLQSGLQFAMLFSAQRLHDSLALTQILQGFQPTQITAPADELQRRWVSLRVARETTVQNYQTQIEALQKPKVMKALLDAMDAANRQWLGWTFSQNFLDQFHKILSLNSPPVTPEKLGLYHGTERQNLLIALSTLVNLTDTTVDPGLAPRLLYQAKRLALSWALLTDSTVVPYITADNQAALEQLMDQAAQAFADDVLKVSPGLPNDLVKIAQTGSQEFLRQGRLDFATNLQKKSQAIQKYMNEEVNLQYLLKMRQGDIESLGASQIVGHIMDDVAKAQTYAEGYQTFRLALIDFAKNFTFASKLPRKITIGALADRANGARWNPAVGNKQVPEKLRPYVNPSEQGWLGWTSNLFRTQKIGPREKDLNDLVQIATFLRFNVYEFLGDQKPTFENLGFDNSWIARYRQPDHKAYQNIMHEDLADNLPLLASPVNGRELWEVLADSKATPEQNLSVIDPQLRLVEEQIHQLEPRLIKDIAEVDAVRGENTSGLNQEVRTLTTRVIQIAYGLSSAASFSSFYKRMARQLDAPGFYQTQFDGFVSFANQVNLYLILYLGVNAVAARFAPLARISMALGRLLGPVFGVSMSRLNYLVYALFGVSMAEDGYKAHLESGPLDILDQYQKTGSAAPGVAQYSDVVRQTEARNAPLWDLGTQLFVLGGFLFTIWSARAAFKALRSTPMVSALDADRAILGLDRRAPYNERTLRGGLAQSLAKAYDQSDTLAQAVGEAYAKQAFYRIQRQMHFDIMSWRQRLDGLMPVLKEVGLTRETCTQQKALNDVLTGLNEAYKQGKMLSSEYLERKAAITSLYQQLEGIWKSMGDPEIANYYSYVWARAADVTAAESAGSIAHFDQRISQRFAKEIDNLYGNTGYRVVIRNGRIDLARQRSADTQKMDQVMENIANQLRQNPDKALQNLKSLQNSANSPEVQP
jgi:hypothetical protein